MRVTALSIRGPPETGQTAPETLGPRHFRHHARHGVAADDPPEEGGFKGLRPHRLLPPAQPLSAPAATPRRPHEPGPPPPTAPRWSARVHTLGLSLAMPRLTCCWPTGWLHKWNKVYNLTALRHPDEMLSHHLIDSLTAIAPLQRHCQSAAAGRCRKLARCMCWMWAPAAACPAWCWPSACPMCA